MTATACLPSLGHLDTVAESRWRIDPATARVTFSGRARLGPPVRAWFTGVEGSVAVTDDISRAAVHVSVDVRTVGTGNAAYDELLRLADPFDADTHPFAVYRSHRVEWDGDRAQVSGELTIRGITRPLALDAVCHPVRGPGLTDRAAFTARTTIERAAFGLDLRVPGGKLFTPRELSLEIDVAAVRVDA